MFPQWLLQIRGSVPRTAGIVLGLVPVFALIALWWFITRGAPEERIIGPSSLPSPVEVLNSVSELFTSRDVVHNAIVSLRRVALGYLLAVAICLPLGILMASFGSVRALFAPSATACGYIPIVALAPIMMLLLGLGERHKVVFLALAFGIYLLPQIVAAIDSVGDVYLRTAYTLGASRLQIIRRVLIPVALPSIWQGMRLAFGVGWTYLVFVEMFVIEDGLGALIGISQRRGPREHIYLIIVLITLIAWVSDLIWGRLGQLLFPYQRKTA
jgi:NitT/TauT family transport system permease protein